MGVNPAQPQEMVWTTNFSPWSWSWRSSCAAPGPIPVKWRARCTPNWRRRPTGSSYAWNRPYRQRATDLASYFGVGKATMSRQLRALEDLGLVAREPDPADGRAFLVHLTDEGLARFRSVRDARRDRYVRKLADWDRTEVAELARLLHQLNARAES